MLSWIEISKNSLKENLAHFKSLASGSQIWPVLKSNAYGHGLEQVASVLDNDKNATGFSVVSLDEALLLRTMTVKPIMVLSFFEMSEALLASGQNISLPVYDLKSARQLAELARKNHSLIKVNVKVDTGTSRLGFEPEEAAEAIKTIQKLEGLQVVSIFSHFAESESSDLSFSNHQSKIFTDVAKHFKIPTHLACTAASLVKNYDADIVRLGLGLYGLWPSTATRSRGRSKGLKLRPVLSWKTRIIQLKSVEAGRTIGYNRTYKVKKPCQIATLPVGYFDGFDRALSNKGHVLIGGQICPVRGNVCMNLIMVELPSRLKCRVGDEAVLIGSQAKKQINFDDWQKITGRISYELVSRLGSHIGRYIV